MFSRELQKRIAESAGVDPDTVADVMSAATIEAMRFFGEREELHIKRFGTLRLRVGRRSVRTNQRTGITVEKEGRVRVTFAPARSLRHAARTMLHEEYRPAGAEGPDFHPLY